MEDHKGSSATDAANAQGSPKTESSDNTLCEVAQKISSAALLINRAALVIQELSNRQQSGSKIVLPTGRSFTLSEECSTQTDN